MTKVDAAVEIASIAREASMRLNNAAVLEDESTWRAVREMCDELDLLAQSVESWARAERSDADNG